GVNFVAGRVGDPSLPVVRAIIERLKAKGTLGPVQLVGGCLDLLGRVEVSPETRQEVTAQAKEWGETGWASEKSAKTADKRVGEMLQLIVATREYQFA